MASFRPLTLNPNGHDALLDATDNLTLENAPQVDTDAANKLYVDTEINTVETNLTTDYDAKIQAEEDARIAADSQLQTNIDNEEAARIAADTTLQGNIDTEAVTRGDADTDLQNQIDAITGGDTPTDNIYVERSGDDMSGNLTLGTDKITLNATEGSGNFFGALEAASIDGGTY